MLQFQMVKSAIIFSCNFLSSVEEVSLYPSEFHHLYSGSHISLFLKNLILLVISCDISEFKKKIGVLFYVTFIQYK